MPVAIPVKAVYGRLTVLSEAPQGAGRNRRFVCRCTCGTIKEVFLNSLRSGTSRSCGCLAAELTVKRGQTHGLSNAAGYSCWRAMNARCSDPNNPSYEYYGGKGITVFEGWRNDPAAFLDHIGPRPSKRHSIDRINSALGYEPGNVRWATDSQQNRNKPAINKWIEYRGELRLLIDVAKETGTRLSTVRTRYRRGWPDDELFGVIRK